MTDTRIMGAQIVTAEFAEWLRPLGVTVQAGDEWDTADRWPNEQARFAAHTCYRIFGYGALAAAEICLREAERARRDGC